MSPDNEATRRKKRPGNARRPVSAVGIFTCRRGLCPPTGPRLVQILFEAAGLFGRPQLGQGFGFDLAHALTRHAEFFTQFG